MNGDSRAFHRRLTGGANPPDAASNVARRLLKGAPMSTRHLARILALSLLFASGIFVAACNTVEGAGEDIQEAGEGIEDAAD
jgi:predicted small secreted protein